MNPQYIVQGIFITAGLVALLASVFDWNWFFSAQNTKFIVDHFGRTRARIFYGVLGVILMGMAIVIGIGNTEQ
jgi:small neutral amino acid transporter SnatA (MarC family)